MDTTKFSPTSIVKLDMLNEDQLEELSRWCKNRAYELDFEKGRAEQIEREAKWKREQEEAEAKEKVLVTKLKKFIKPGTILKMKGCRDRNGIREFVNWDTNNSLVCWQIDENEDRTNYVTTHFPDKVSKVLINGKFCAVRDLT